MVSQAFETLDEKYPFDERQLRIIIESVPANVFFKDPQGRYQVTSHICSMLNAGDGGSIVGKTDLEIQPDPVLGKKFYEEDLQIAETHEGMEYLQEMVFGGASYFYKISKSPVFDSNGELMGIIGMVSDMTEQVMLQRELEKMSVIDEMTGVYNRSYYEKELADSECDVLPTAVLLADCNDLKGVNDTFGHKQGDLFIQTVANRLRSLVRESDTVARIGGDEFVAVLPGCDRKRCEQIIEEMTSEQNQHRIGDFTLSAACGYTIVEDAGTTVSQALEAADADMYAQKKAGR